MPSSFTSFTALLSIAAIAFRIASCDTSSEEFAEDEKLRALRKNLSEEEKDLNFTVEQMDNFARLGHDDKAEIWVQQFYFQETMVKGAKNAIKKHKEFLKEQRRLRELNKTRTDRQQ